MANRLAEETSPYLLQHKDNPVDWYPWGDEAFERARREDRPILLSVGYSACHWCHVMEHESFADRETARLMNDKFVSIKVDREERPDVDALYMQAVQQMTGQGGWPMTVFLTPDGEPFFGGTYFPPAPRHGIPAFRQVLQAISDAYDNRRQEVDESARKLTDSLSMGMTVSPPAGDLDPSLLSRAYSGLARRYDAERGGFGGAPKFPQPMILEFLLRYWKRSGEDDALTMASFTLDRMAAGGIYDHLGGGFHRYSTDAHWLVPHFEKMLYDNALLAKVYLEGHLATGSARFRKVCEETLDFVLREMTDPEGGFYSSQDADSEGEEGRFYVWSADQLRQAAGSDAAAFMALYGAGPAGNWEGTNILHRPRRVAEVADEIGMGVEELEGIAERIRSALLATRDARIRPGLDDKIIVSWNAMTISALAHAGRSLNRRDYLDAADRAADFILSEMMEGGRLRRSWRAGKAQIDAFLEDHALLASALVQLYFATFDVGRVVQARELVENMISRFWDPEREMFFDTAADTAPLVVRPRDIYDNATPSGTSAAAEALIWVSRLTGEPKYERAATSILGSLAPMATEVPQAFGRLLSALSHHLHAPTEVVVAGEAGGADTVALLEVASSRFLPDTALGLASVPPDDQAVEMLPMLRDRETRNGHAMAYVCRHYTCKQPVSEPKALELDVDAL